MPQQDKLLCRFYLNCVHGDMCDVAFTDVLRDYYCDTRQPVRIYTEEPYCFMRKANIKVRSLKIKYKEL